MTHEHKTVFLRSLGFTTLLVAMAALGCFLAPRLMLRILFGLSDTSTELVLLTRLMPAVMGISALL